MLFLQLTSNHPINKPTDSGFKLIMEHKKHICRLYVSSTVVSLLFSGIPTLQQQGDLLSPH